MASGLLEGSSRFRRGQLCIDARGRILPKWGGCRVTTVDNQQEVPEYLKLDPTEEPLGLENVTSRDHAHILLRSQDYDAQLMAIRDVFSRHRHSDRELSDEIKHIDEIKVYAERLVDERPELLYISSYQGMAHSMAAVGILAPFVESMFYSAFYRVREAFFSMDGAHAQHPRWELSAKGQWDCHFVYDKDGNRKKNLVGGILELAEAVGLAPHLPHDLKPTLEALFEYRNKMFHFGMEWPVSERSKFEKRIVGASWPPDWFGKETLSGDPALFYLTDAFVDHCLKSIDHVIDGIGTFAQEQLAARRKK